MKFLLVTLQLLSLTVLSRCSLLKTTGYEELLHEIFEFIENPFQSIVFVSKNLRDSLYNYQSFALRKQAAKALGMPELLKVPKTEAVEQDLRSLLMMLNIDNPQFRISPIVLEIFKYRNLQSIMFPVLNSINANAIINNPPESSEFFLEAFDANQSDILSYLLSNPEVLPALLDVWTYTFTTFSYITSSWDRAELISLLILQIKANESIQLKLKTFLSISCTTFVSDSEKRNHWNNDLQNDEFVEETQSEIEENNRIKAAAQLFANLMLFSVSECIWKESFQHLPSYLKLEIFLYCLITPFQDLLEENINFFKSLRMDFITDFNRTRKSLTSLVGAAWNLAFEKEMNDYELVDRFTSVSQNCSAYYMKMFVLIALKTKRFGVLHCIRKSSNIVEKTCFDHLDCLYNSYDIKNDPSTFFTTLSFLSFEAKNDLFSLSDFKAFELVFKYYKLQRTEVLDNTLRFWAKKLPEYASQDFPERFVFNIDLSVESQVTAFLGFVRFADVSLIQRILQKIESPQFERTSMCMLSSHILIGAAEDQSFREYLVQFSKTTQICFDRTDEDADLDVSQLHEELNVFVSINIVNVLQVLERDDQFQKLLRMYSTTCSDIYLDIMEILQPEDCFDFFYTFKKFFFYWLSSDEWKSFKCVENEILIRLATAYFPEKMENVKNLKLKSCKLEISEF